MEDKKTEKKSKKSVIKLSGKTVTGKAPEKIDIEPQLKSEESEQGSSDLTVSEAILSIQARRKRARILKRLLPKLQRARKMAQKRRATSEKLEVRAKRAARTLVRKRYSGRKVPYAQMSDAEKINVDKIVSKKSDLIRRMAKRLLPKVRQAETERLASFRRGRAIPDDRPKQTNEENLDELSVNKLSSYRKKAIDDVTSGKLSKRKENKRVAGIGKSVSKETDKMNESNNRGPKATLIGTSDDKLKELYHYNDHYHGKNHVGYHVHHYKLKDNASGTGKVRHHHYVQSQHRTLNAAMKRAKIKKIDNKLHDKLMNEDANKFKKTLINTEIDHDFKNRHKGDSVDKKFRKKTLMKNIKDRRALGEGLKMSPEASKRLSAAVASRAKGRIIPSHSTVSTKDGYENTFSHTNAKGEKIHHKTIKTKDPMSKEESKKHLDAIRAKHSVDEEVIDELSKKKLAGYLIKGGISGFRAKRKTRRLDRKISKLAKKRKEASDKWSRRKKGSEDALNRVLPEAAESGYYVGKENHTNVIDAIRKAKKKKSETGKDHLVHRVVGGKVKRSWASRNGRYAGTNQHKDTDYNLKEGQVPYKPKSQKLSAGGMKAPKGSDPTQTPEAKKRKAELFKKFQADIDARKKARRSKNSVNENWSDGISSRNMHSHRRKAKDYLNKANYHFRSAKNLKSVNKAAYHMNMTKGHSAYAKSIKHGYHGGQEGSMVMAKKDWKVHNDSAKEHRQKHKALSESYEDIMSVLESKDTPELINMIEGIIREYKDHDNNFADTMQSMLHDVLPKDAVTESLLKKSEKFDVPFSDLKEVYDRGIEQWDGFHGTAEQNAFARVNSYAARGKAWRLDEDVRENEGNNPLLDFEFENLFETLEPQDINDLFELSLSTKNSYKKKAISDIDNQSMKHSDARIQHEYGDMSKDKRDKIQKSSNLKIRNRQRGINRVSTNEGIATQNLYAKKAEKFAAHHVTKHNEFHSKAEKADDGTAEKNYFEKKAADSKKTMRFAHRRLNKIDRNINKTKDKGE